MTYSQMVDRLKPAIVLNDEEVKNLQKFASLLLEWNEKFNLTAITEESQVIEKHFYDCLVPCQTLSLDGKTVADLGTGAGFPGLVWAIVFPACQVTLVEATTKKCAFLQAVIDACGLKNVRIINKRCEEMKEREFFDLVAARALAPMGILLEIGAPLVKVGGIFLAMKGSKGQDEFNKTGKEINKLGLIVKSVQTEELPDGLGMRQNFFFQKANKTSVCYPRPWATIMKKPLV